MNLTLRQQINDNPAASAAKLIVEQIQQAGHEAHFVGGGVRDLLLDRHPKDFDIATAARPDELQALFPDAVLVGAKFGVLLVRRHGVCVEVATFREEGDYHDRRRPELVRFSDLKNDAIRRDFTVNALYYDPVGDKITDLTDGLADIQHRLLRTVKNPGNRFREDALRVLRGIRFAANLDFEVEPVTWTAVCKYVGLLHEISMERVRDELCKGFTGGHPDRFLDLLDRSGFLSEFLPEVEQLKGCEQPPEFHPEGDVFVHTQLMLRLLKPNPSFELAMATLLHDIGKPPTQTFEDRIRFSGHDKLGAEMAEEICRRLRLSNVQTEAITQMVKRHMQFINVPSMRKSTLNRFLAAPNIEEELELHRVDCLSSHRNLETYELTMKKLWEFREADDLKGALPAPLVNGTDLIAQGLKPGPSFSHILRAVFDAQLDGQIKTKSEGLAFALSVATSANADVITRTE